MIQLRGGRATITPTADPCATTAVGSARLASGNHLYKACTVIGYAGPSPAPSNMRHTANVKNPTEPIIGNCTNDQKVTRPTSSQRVSIHLASTLTRIAENGYRRKKLDPRK